MYNGQKKNKAIVHTDAVQALGKITVDFEVLDVDALTISSHKAYGPQGVAALVVNNKIDVVPFIKGGGQERGLRSGTENLAGIIGFGKACERAAANTVLFDKTIRPLTIIFGTAFGSDGCCNLWGSSEEIA